MRQMESRDRRSSQFCVLKVANSHCYLSARDKDFFFSTVLYNTRFEFVVVKLVVTALEILGERRGKVYSQSEQLKRKFK